MRCVTIALILSCLAQAARADDICLSAMNMATDAGNQWKGLTSAPPASGETASLSKKYFAYEECSLGEDYADGGAIGLMCSYSLNLPKDKRSSGQIVSEQKRYYASFVESLSNCPGLQFVETSFDEVYKDEYSKFSIRTKSGYFNFLLYFGNGTHRDGHEIVYGWMRGQVQPFNNGN